MDGKNFPELGQAKTRSSAEQLEAEIKHLESLLDRKRQMLRLMYDNPVIEKFLALGRN